MNSAVAPLRYGSFRIMWIASLLSALGTFIQSVAGSWLMLDLTGSNTWVGFMVASSTLPILFLALAARALADMFDRTRLMLAAQSIMGISAVAMAVLTYFDAITPLLLLGLGLLLGVGVALNLPTWQALLPDLVPRGMIASAVALQSAAFNVARAVGPALGGLVLASLGAAAGFGINSLTYGFIITALIVVARRIDLPEPEPTSFTTAIALGVRFARFTPVFRRLLTLAALFAVFSAVLQSVLPSHTVALGGAELAYGILLGAMGVGALVAAGVRSSFARRFEDRPTRITITGFGVSGLIVALAPNVAIAALGMGLAGLCWVLTLTGLNATAQLISPHWIRGRAMSLYSLAFSGVLPLGSILAGVVADATDTSMALIVLSSASIVLGLISPLFHVPSVEQVEQPEFTNDWPRPVHDETVGGHGVVIVLNTWHIDRADLAAFVEVMREVRLVRLRTGAHRWGLARTAADPLTLVEFFEIGSWQEHLAQHGRIDDASAELILRARAFDRSGGPTAEHLIGIDLRHPDLYEDLIRRHEELHREDGSVPVQ